MSYIYVQTVYCLLQLTINEEYIFWLECAKINRNKHCEYLHALPLIAF